MVCVTLLCRHQTEWCVRRYCADSRRNGVYDVTVQTADGMVCMTLLCRQLTEWCVWRYCADSRRSGVYDVTVQTPDGVVFMTLLCRQLTEWCVWRYSADRCRHQTEWRYCADTRRSGVYDVTVQIADGVVCVTLLCRQQTEWCVWRYCADSRRSGVYDVTVQTPDGVVCPGRINTKPVPALPQAFSYTVEVVNPINRQVSFMQVGWPSSCPSCR